MNGTAIDLTSAGRAGLQLLLDAWRRAERHRVDTWQFAVEIEALCSAGLTHTDLRVLLVQSLVEHAHEVTRKSNRLRRFQKVHSLMLSKTACFVLTEEGRRVAARDANGSAASKKRQPTGRESNTQSAQSIAKPFWDVKRRELRLGDEIVKHFTHRAPAQELILAVFQEEGWPTAIDDPLPVKSGMNPQEHRYQTIRNLNRAQRPLRIRFTTKSDKQTIHWQVVRPRSRKM